MFWSFVVLTSAASDFKVKLASVGSNIKLPCITDNTSLLTTLKYSSNSERTMIAYYKDGEFTVKSENYVGRILVQNLSTVVLNNVTVEDSGFYRCRVDFQNGGEDDNIIQLQIGGILHMYLSMRQVYALFISMTVI